MELLRVSVLVCTLIGTVVCSCPTGWMRYGSNCYHFSHDKEDFSGALALCKLIGGSLLEINNANESNFIVGQLVTHSDKYEPFIALSDIVEENVWVWIESKVHLDSSSFANWADGQPDNSHGIENCVVVKQTGEWRDDQCYNLHEYICEKSDPKGAVVIG